VQLSLLSNGSANKSVSTETSVKSSEVKVFSVQYVPRYYKRDLDFDFDFDFDFELVIEVTVGVQLL
jgi:hypothetical protein